MTQKIPLPQDGQSIKEYDTFQTEEIQEVTAQLAQKLTQGEVSVYDINKNKGLIDETYLSDTLKQQMVGNTSIHAVPADDSITIQKLAINKKSTNLYNPETSKNGYYINPFTGGEIADERSIASDFIPINPSTNYYIRSVRAIAFYNTDKVFVSAVSDATAKQNYVLITPSNIKYMRISWVSTDMSDQQQINESSEKLPYEPYYIVINKKYVEKPNIEINDLPTLPIDKLEFSQQTSNLFNKDAIEENSAVNNTTGYISTATGFILSDFISIMPNKTYIIKTARAYALYDNTKKFIIGKPDSTSQTNVVINAPENGYFLRFSWYPSGDLVTLDDQQVNIGDTLLPFENYGYKIPKEYLDIPKISVGEISVSLPPEIYAVTGKEINIYFQNIVNVPLKDYQIDVTCPLGKHYQDRWTATPTTSGTHVITISLYKDFEMVAQGNSTIKVKDVSVGNGVTKDAVIIGDSTIAQDYLVNHLETTLAADTLTVNLLGTLGTYGELHNEGRGGWKMADYRTNKTHKDVVNPFYNPNTSDFDFSYYMTNQGYASMDYAVLCLGINDTFSFTSDSALLDAIPTILSDFNFVVNSILAYDNNIKVGICVTIPPNESQDAFGDAYNNGQTQWRYKRNNALWIKKLISEFKGKTSQRIYLVPDNNNINAKTGFRDGVHPNQEIGDMQRADTFYYWFKSFEG